MSRRSELRRLGEVLVSASVRDDPLDALAEEHQRIHETFKRDRDAETAYFQMGFLCARVLARARQIEGSAP